MCSVKCLTYTFHGPICTLINPECRVYNLSVFRLKIGWCNLIGCKSNRVRSTVHQVLATTTMLMMPWQLI